MVRDELAVDVGEADLVVVKQVDGTNARARNCLRGIAADAADAEYGDACAGERIYCVCSNEELHPGEFV